MCRETIRRAVVQKFNEVKGWDCKTTDDLYNKIDDNAEANRIINSIKICDPAVGSGHFLVSALNEIIAVKSELRVLLDRNGKRLKEYHVEVENDELMITDEDGEFLEYNPRNPESQRVQETLFHEKQTIIESCLFGVDINPNSVKICRLRLWIELLKNAYYKESGELETLPNIDINIKCGNSLISRYALDADIKTALKRSKWSIDSYRIAVMTYRNAQTKDEKRAMERLIDQIKSDFESEVAANDKRLIKLSKAKGELLTLTTQTTLFDRTKAEKAAWEKQVKALTETIKNLETELEEIRNNKIYENAFEWRFEFPEVLNNEGDFVGFDVVIGNPPYGVLFSENMKDFLKKNFEGIQQKMFDSFLFFISLGEKILKLNAIKSFIVPNNLIFQMTFEKARDFLINNYVLLNVINLGDKVFEDADVPTCIYVVTKSKKADYNFGYLDLREIKDKTLLSSIKEYEFFSKSSLLETYSLVFGVTKEHSNIINKINNQSNKFSDIIDVASYGIGSGGDKIFKVSKGFSIELSLENNILFPVFSGSNILKYQIKYEDEVIIYTTKDIDINFYPNTLNYLTPFKNKLSQKRETIKGTLPWWCLHWPRNKELYLDEKLVLRQTGDKLIGAIDYNSFFVMDSVMVIKFKNSFNINLKYALALLNSTLFAFLYDNIAKEKGRAFAQVKPQNIKQLPIKLISPNEQKPFINLVDKVQLAVQNNLSADILALERQIDQLVYQLYDLTEEEIKIIENN